MSKYSIEISDTLLELLKEAHLVHVKRMLGSEKKPLDVFHYWLMKKYLVEPISLNMLIRKSNVDRKLIYSTITHLTNIGVVEKRISDRDKRETVVSLTDEGRDFLPILDEQYESLIDFSAIRCSVNEEKTILKYLNHLLENFVKE